MEGIIHPPKAVRAVPEDPYAILWTDVRELTPTDKIRFDILEPLHRVSIFSPLPKKRGTERFYDKFFDWLPNDLQTVLEENAGEYYKSMGTISSVEKSLKKMDFPRCTDYKANIYWEQAKRLVRSECEEMMYMNTRIASTEEIMTTMEFSTAPGQPWTRHGIKNKGQWFRNPYVCPRYLYDFSHPPVWKICDKVEWYHIDDLKNDKVRTFIIPPVNFLFHQKRLYLTQNEGLKGFWWSAYGFNPYMGGTDALARKLLVHKLFLFYDVSGWDRLLSILRTVYRQRNAYHDEDEKDLADYIAFNTIITYLLTPDGLLFRKEIGNNSGSGNTTGDNIFAHFYVLALALLDLFEGDTDLVSKTVANLFGDDNIMSIPNPYNYSLDHIKEVFTRVYKSFGFSGLDPFVIQDTLEGCEFLGFKFKKIEQGWIPCYNQERLVASFVFNIKKLPDDAARISKAWTLCLMAAGGDRETFEALRRAVGIYLRKLAIDNSDPSIRAYVKIGPPSYQECISFYLGLESSLSDQYIALVDETVFMEVGGFKNVDCRNGATNKEEIEKIQKDGCLRDILPSKYAW